MVPSVEEILDWAAFARRQGNDGATDLAALYDAVEELADRIRGLERKDIVAELEGDLSKLQEELDDAKARVSGLEAGGDSEGSEVVAQLRGQIAEFIEYSRVERSINADLRAAHAAEIQQILGAVDECLCAGLGRVRDVVIEVVAGMNAERARAPRKARRREPNPTQLTLDSIVSCATPLRAPREP